MRKIPPFLGAGACLILACSGEAPTDPPESDATTGAIQIAVVTAGIDLDPDGYSVLLDGIFVRRMDVTGSVALTDVPPGSHVLAIEDVERNCFVSDNPRSVSVNIGDTSKISFAAACTGVADSSGITSMDFGGMPGATGWTIPRGLSDDGGIAGWAEFGSRLRAFHRSTAGIWSDLNAEAETTLGRSLTTVAWDLSNHRVVGATDFDTPAERPVLWQEQGASWAVIPLPLEAPGAVPADGGFAHGINASGDLIAGRVSMSGRMIPVVWAERGPDQWELEILLLPESGFPFGIAHAVNTGTPSRVAGEIGFSAVVWTREGAAWGPPTVLPTPAGYVSHAFGINRQGDIAGRISLCPSTHTAVLWRYDGAGWERIELTERIAECGDDPSSVAWDVDDARRVVGEIDHAGKRPFLWRDGRLQLLAAGGVAWKINEENQFVGPGADYRHAFLWTIQ